MLIFGAKKCEIRRNLDDFRRIPTKSDAVFAISVPVLPLFVPTLYPVLNESEWGDG